MLSRLLTFLALMIGLLAMPPIAAATVSAQEEVDRLSPRSGTIVLPGAEAEIELGEEFEFYGPADTQRILVDIWDNPPQEAEGVLGLVMPAGVSPRERSWAAVVTYEPIGWVSAEDARTADYDALMAQMQESARKANQDRRAQGFPSVTITGWVQQPRYDSVSHTVSWARELAFSDDDVSTLHYDLRTLGRRGMLSLNIVSSMGEMHEIRAAADILSDSAGFQPGARYEDFDAARDRTAEIGIAGLVASGAGLVVAKNLGWLAMLAKLALPLGIALLIFAALLLTPLRRLLGRERQAATR